KGATATEPRERSGDHGVTASERAGGSGGAKPRGVKDGARIVDAVLAPLDYTPRFWIVLMTISIAGTLLWLVSIAYTLWKGIGAWGNNVPVAWAFAIVSSVWW